MAGTPGWQKGRKRGPWSAERKASKAEKATADANRSKPRPGYLTRRAANVAKKIREAMQIGVLSTLQGEGLKRMLEIMLTGEDRDAIRAWEALANRFGLPPQSIQDVRMESAALPMFNVNRTQHTAACSRWKNEGCDCGAGQAAEVRQ